MAAYDSHPLRTTTAKATFRLVRPLVLPPLTKGGFEFQVALAGCCSHGSVLPGPPMPATVRHCTVFKSPGTRANQCRATRGQSLFTLFILRRIILRPRRTFWRKQNCQPHYAKNGYKKDDLPHATGNLNMNHLLNLLTSSSRALTFFCKLPTHSPRAQ